MTSNTSIAEPETEIINTAPEPVKLSRQQEINRYLWTHSGRVPLLRTSWPVLFKVSELIAQNRMQGQWLNRRKVVDITLGSKLQHDGYPVGYFALSHILNEAFIIEEKVSIGPYALDHRCIDGTRNGKRTLEDEYWVEVDQAALTKYNAFLAQVRAEGAISGEETLEAQNT